VVNRTNIIRLNPITIKKAYTGTLLSG